jgi:hypothetical protein
MGACTLFRAGSIEFDHFPRVSWLRIKLELAVGVMLDAAFLGVDTSGAAPFLLFFSDDAWLAAVAMRLPASSARLHL